MPPFALCIPAVAICVGDSYDNALAETINGLFKAEVIHRRGPCRSFDAVEYPLFELELPKLGQFVYVFSLSIASSSAFTRSDSVGRCVAKSAISSTPLTAAGTSQNPVSFR